MVCFFWSGHRRDTELERLHNTPRISELRDQYKFLDCCYIPPQFPCSTPSSLPQKKSMLITKHVVSHICVVIFCLIKMAGNPVHASRHYTAKNHWQELPWRMSIGSMWQCRVLIGYVCENSTFLFFAFVSLVQKVQNSLTAGKHYLLLSCYQPNRCN